MWRWVLLSNVRTFSLQSLLLLGLGATACIQGMLSACSCVCDRSDKRRKDKKESEFDKEKTNRRAISTVNAVLLLTSLVSFRSKCEVVTLCTGPPTKRKDCLRATDHVPTGSVTQRSITLAYNGLHLPHSRTNTATSRKAEHEQRVKARVKSTCQKYTSFRERIIFSKFICLGKLFSDQSESLRIAMHVDASIVSELSLLLIQ